MKKFAIKSVAAAAGILVSGGVFAGTFTSTLRTFAAEGLSGTTAVTLPNMVYTMGVTRTTAQDFTVILTPPAGTAFSAGACAAGLPVQAGNGTVVVSQKRSSTTECAYEVDVTAATDTSTTLSFNNMALASHGLNVAGAAISMTIALKDLGETAFIDNVGSLTNTVANSASAMSLVAVADTNTITNVDDTRGPLFGFLPEGSASPDTADSAAAAFIIRNNPSGYVAADGTTAWDFRTANIGGNSILITVAGDFTGRASSGGFTASVNGNGTTAPAVTVTTNSVASFTVSAAALAASPANTTVTTTFNTAGTASLGVARTFGVAGTADYIVGTDGALSGALSTWWTWGANATQLMSPYMSTNPQYVTRFSLLNLGATSVGYTVQCYTEGSSVATNGAAGTLKAAGTTVLNAADVCSFSGAPRGAVLFTINAPINAIKGVYNIVDAATGANGFVPLTRPYAQGFTTE